MDENKILKWVKEGYTELGDIEYNLTIRSNKQEQYNIQHHQKSVDFFDKLEKLEYLFGGGWYHWREDDNLLDYLDIIFEEKDYINSHRKPKSKKEAFRWFMTEEISKYFTDREYPYHLDKKYEYSLRFIDDEKFPMHEIYVDMHNVETLNCLVGVPCSVGYRPLGSFICNKKDFIKELENLLNSPEKHSY